MNEIEETSNYRPISILNVFSKVIERIILDRMIDLLDQFNLICENQHDFRFHSVCLYFTRRDYVVAGRSSCRPLFIKHKIFVIPCIYIYEIPLNARENEQKLLHLFFMMMVQEIYMFYPFFIIPQANLKSHLCTNV